MPKNRKLTNEEVQTLLEIQDYVQNKKDAKTVKYQLFDAIEEIMGEDWYSFKKETRNAIEFMCFLSVERGLFYAKPETIAKKHGIGKSTVYGALRVLQDKGVLVKLNRTSRTQNGLGSALYLVTLHPYFNVHANYLKLEKKANWKANWKAENAENPCESKDEEVKKESTYSLPSFSTKPKHMVIQSTVYAVDENDCGYLSKDNKDKPKWVKFVPKVLNSMFAGLYGEKLLAMWRKMTLAVKNVKLGRTLDKETIQTLGVTVLRSMMKKDKEVQLTEDEMCAYVYTAMKNSVLVELGNRYKESMEFDGFTGYYETVDGDYVNAGDLPRDYSGLIKDTVLTNWLASVYE